MGEISHLFFKIFQKSPENLRKLWIGNEINFFRNLWIVSKENPKVGPVPPDGATRSIRRPVAFYDRFESAGLMGRARPMRASGRHWFVDSCFEYANGILTIEKKANVGPVPLTWLYCTSRNLQFNVIRRDCGFAGQRPAPCQPSAKPWGGVSL